MFGVAVGVYLCLCAVKLPSTFLACPIRLETTGGQVVALVVPGRRQHRPDSQVAETCSVSALAECLTSCGPEVVPEVVPLQTKLISRFLYMNICISKEKEMKRGRDRNETCLR